MGRLGKAKDTSGGARTEHVLVIESGRLVPFFERMKVWELAQLAGVSVDALVAEVVRAAGLPDFPRVQTPRPSLASAKAAATDHPVEPEPEPELGRLLGRATRRELKVVVDRWVLGQVLAVYEWNVSHASARLEVSRKKLRQRWAVVRGRPIGALFAKLASSEPAWGVPAAPSLAGLLEQGATYRQIHQVIDRWVVEHTLADEGGNITRSASSLQVTRRTLRTLRHSAAEDS